MNTRSRTPAGTTAAMRATSASRMRNPPPCTVLLDRIGVEGPCRRPRSLSLRREAVAALLDDLAVDDLLVVLARDEPRIFESRHHLVESGRRPSSPVTGERTADVAPRLVAAPQQAKNDELQVRDFRNSTGGHNCVLYHNG